MLVAARGVERRNTWYLASDQFAFLTFARDLAHGSAFHDASVLEVIAPSRNPARTYDALVQTYLWSGDKLFSRYPPGFPALLAVAGTLGGEAAQHALNPVLYLTVLAVLGWLSWTLLRGRSRALAAGTGAAAAWLLLLLPTDVHLWGITVARDLPAHLLALLAIVAAVGGRVFAAGLALGLACTFRPDAVLYAVAVAAISHVRGERPGTALRAGVGLVIGAAPLFAYNTATRGHPFAFTQAGEFSEILGRILSPAAAWAQSITFDSGGAFRLSNLPETLPGNLAILAASFGWCAFMTAVGILWAARARRIVLAALLPYPAVALPFFGCWSHPDARYLAGVALCLIPLTAIGAVTSCAYLARPRRSAVLRLAAVAAGVYALLASRLPAPLRLPGIGPAEIALGLALAVAALLPLVPRSGSSVRRLAPLAPAMALLVVVAIRLATGTGTRDPFQGPDAARARATLGALLPKDAVLFTSESLGRPAENIAHYVGVPTLYLSELPLLRTDHERASILLAMNGRRPFFLLEEARIGEITGLRTVGGLRIVARRHGPDVLDWFVDPRRGAGGVVLYELVLSEQQRRLLHDFKGHVEGDL